MIPLRIRNGLRRWERRLRARLWSLGYRQVHIGAGVAVGRRCRVRIEGHGRIVLGAGVEIEDGTTLAVYDHGVLRVEAGSFVGHYCTLAARTRVELGEGTYLAELVSVRDHDHDVRAAPASGRIATDAVEIGARVWLGAKVTVLRGARIGNDTVVGANAVVRGELPPSVVAVGAPARPVRALER